MGWRALRVLIGGPLDGRLSWIVQVGPWSHEGPVSERGRQREWNCVRRMGSGIVAFGDGGRGHEPRNVGASRSCYRQGNRCFLTVARRNAALSTPRFYPNKTHSGDFPGALVWSLLETSPSMPGLWFDPWWGSKDPTCFSAKKRNKTKHKTEAILKQIQ